MLAFESGEPGLSSGRVDAGLNPFREPQVVVGMLRQRRRGVFSREKLLIGVLAHGLQQPIPKIRPFSIGHVYQRLVDQVAENVDDAGAVRVESGGHVLGRLEREAVDEDRQPAQQSALGSVSRS